jgi:hypothetical protein
VILQERECVAYCAPRPRVEPVQFQQFLSQTGQILWPSQMPQDSGIYLCMIKYFHSHLQFSPPPLLAHHRTHLNPQTPSSGLADPADPLRTLSWTSRTLADTRGHSRTLADPRGPSRTLADLQAAQAVAAHTWGSRSLHWILPCHQDGSDPASVRFQNHLLRICSLPIRSAHAPRESVPMPM